ncbi:MAG: hypothetical protein K6G29_07650 [Clostridiales bacterium]|nr:hypothetical protein [Clostridiales bacterium]
MAIYFHPVNGGMFDSTQAVEEVGGFPRGDKAVDAAFFAKMFSCFYKDGIIGENSFRVTASSGLGITVSPGVAWAYGRMAWQQTALTFTLGAGKTWTILLRLNTAAGEFTCVATDSGAGLPNRTESVCDLILAEISIPAGATTIAASAITDTRTDAAKCGVVTSAVDALGTVNTAQNATMLGGTAASEYVKKSGAVMTGALRAAADTSGASVVRNISYGSTVPATLANGEIFIQLAD